MANVGGQAVLEGVMMRGPGNWAVAVRTPSGEIAQVSRPIDSAMARHVFFRLPIVRGVMALGESLAIGFRALAISANYAQRQEGEDGEVDTELSRGALIFAFAIAIGFAIAVFKVGPALITDQLPVHSGGWFVIVEGLIPVSMFVAYLALLSLLPHLPRLVPCFPTSASFSRTAPAPWGRPPPRGWGSRSSRRSPSDTRSSTHAAG